MRKTKIAAISILLCGSLLFSSCIGSFGLWNQMKSWNQNISNKFVNEIVFFAFHVVPVYEVSYLVDVLVLNSIEFWSGSNPLADVGTVKTVEGQNGEYLVRTNKDGYTITKKGEKYSLELIYDTQEKTWNAICDNNSFEIMTVNDNGTITVKLQDGNSITVNPDVQGLAQVRAASESIQLYSPHN